MIPLELDGKTPWPNVKAQLKLQEFRTAAIAEMRARDAEHGIGPDGKVYSEVIDAAGRATAVIDPVKARYRHSGEDTVVLIQERWYEFCSEPQDSSDVIVPIKKPERKHKAQLIPAGFPVPDNDTDEVTLMSGPPKRGPGRPRKHPEQGV